MLNTKMESVRRITSDDYLGINEGNLCVKGRFGHEFIHSPERIKTPLIRKNGELYPTSWDEAIEYVAKRFQQIINEHGGRLSAALVLKNAPMKTITSSRNSAGRCWGLTILIIWPI